MRREYALCYEMEVRTKGIWNEILPETILNEIYVIPKLLIWEFFFVPKYISPLSTTILEQDYTPFEQQKRG